MQCVDDFRHNADWLCRGAVSVLSMNGKVKTLRSRQNACHFANGIFKCIFLKLFEFSLLSEIYFWEPKLQWVRVGSENGLAPNRPQAIIWTNHIIVYLCMYGSPGLNDFKKFNLCPEQPGSKIADCNLKCHFVNENLLVSIISPLKSLLWGVIAESILVQDIACCQIFDRPLSQPVITHMSDP